mgnify:CR=1 FL=1
MKNNFEVYQAPIADFIISDDTVCVGDSVIFTASGAVSYEFFVSGISQGATTTNDTQPITGLTNGQVVTVVGSNAQGLQTGVIAQEIETVLPNAVSEDDAGCKQVNTDPVFWAMVKAIQELSAKVKALEEA